MLLKKRIKDNGGWLEIKGFGLSREVFLFGERLDPEASRKIYNHSPDGFNWGYSGSGPSQLALAIMLQIYSKKEAQRRYQAFKSCVIALIGKGGDFDIKVNIEQWQKIMDYPEVTGQVYAEELIHFKAVNNYYPFLLDFSMPEWKTAEFDITTVEYALLSKLTYAQVSELNIYLKLHTKHKGYPGSVNAAKYLNGVYTAIEFCEVGDTWAGSNGLGSGVYYGRSVRYQMERKKSKRGQILLL